MVDLGYLLGGLLVLGLTVQGLLRKVENQSRWPPRCRTGGERMVSAPLPKVLPDEVRWHLDKHKLPHDIVMRFKCPRGHYQLWYIPKLGNTERTFFLKEEL